MKRTLTVLALLLLPLVAAACGGGNTTASSSSGGNTAACPAASGTNGNGAHVSIGSNLQAHPGVSICILSEFRTRPDGLPGLKATYSSAYGNANYTDIGSTAEKNIAAGQCAAGEVFTTDSGIEANSLYVLTDDKN